MAKTKPKKRTASQIGRASVSKGKVFERTVALAFRNIFGESVKRGWQARRGDDAPDIEGVPLWWIECKHHARVNVQKSFKQVEAAIAGANERGDKRGEHMPLIVHHDTGRETLATLRFSDLLKLFELYESSIRPGRRVRALNRQPIDYVALAKTGLALPHTDSAKDLQIALAQPPRR